jgi:hypothetical protein
VEEVLFSRCEYEICSAVYAFEDAVLKLRHITCAPLINLNCCRMWQRDLRPATALLNFPATLLPVPFAGQRLLGPELLTRLQVEGMPLNFLDDVFLLHLPLEAAKGVFQCLALLKLNFRQTKYTSQLDLNSHALMDFRDPASPGVSPTPNFLHFAQKVLIS